jgi:hypothetical protein
MSVVVRDAWNNTRSPHPAATLTAVLLARGKAGLIAVKAAKLGHHVRVALDRHRVLHVTRCQQLVEGAVRPCAERHQAHTCMHGCRGGGLPRSRLYPHAAAAGTTAAPTPAARTAHGVVRLNKRAVKVPSICVRHARLAFLLEHLRAPPGRRQRPAAWCCWLAAAAVCCGQHCGCLQVCVRVDLGLP